LRRRHGCESQHRHCEGQNSLSHGVPPLTHSSVLKCTPHIISEATARHTSTTTGIMSQHAVLKFDGVALSCDQIICWTTLDEQIVRFVFNRDFEMPVLSTLKIPTTSSPRITRTATAPAAVRVQHHRS
jgi:hypothetical protein